MKWINVNEELPPLNTEVIAGFWCYDTMLKEEYAWRWLWGNCILVFDTHPCYKDGKRWLTFGPAHSQITHWMYLPTPPNR